MCIGKISEIPRNLFNLDLVHLMESAENEIIVVSLMGDVIKIKNVLPSLKNDKDSKASQ